VSFNATSVGLDMRALSVLAHAIDEEAGRVSGHVLCGSVCRCSYRRLFVQAHRHCSKLAVTAGRPGVLATTRSGMPLLLVRL
jgi:hypothetical protein